VNNSRTITFCIVVPNIRRSPVRNLSIVVTLAPRILKLFLEFRKIYAPCYELLKCPDFQNLQCDHLFLLSPGAELPLVESFGLLNDLFLFPSILDAGYPVLNLQLTNVLFDVILPSVLGSSL